MPVDVEIRLVAMQPFADGVRHPAHGKNVAGAVECEGLVSIEPFAGRDFLVNRRKPRIVCLEAVGMKSGMRKWIRHQLL